MSITRYKEWIECKIFNLHEHSNGLCGDLCVNSNRVPRQCWGDVESECHVTARLPAVKRGREVQVSSDPIWGEVKQQSLYRKNTELYTAGAGPDPGICKGWGSVSLWKINCIISPANPHIHLYPPACLPTPKPFSVYCLPQFRVQFDFFVYNFSQFRVCMTLIKRFHWKKLIRQVRTRCKSPLVVWVLTCKVCSHTEVPSSRCLQTQKCVQYPEYCVLGGGGVLKPLKGAYDRPYGHKQDPRLYLHAF